MIVLVPIVLALILLFFMVAGAAATGAAAAMFLNLPLATGWHAAWHHPWRLLAFALVLAFVFGGARASSGD